MLIRINPYCLKIDISENSFSDSMIEILESKIRDRLSLNSINLEMSGLSAELISQIKKLCNEQIDRI